jgi:hypothetical protein
VVFDELVYGTFDPDRGRRFFVTTRMASPAEMLKLIVLLRVVYLTFFVLTQRGPS